MSSMEIYGVKADGDIESKFELRNSWLGAALVWTKLGGEVPRQVRLRDGSEGAGPASAGGAGPEQGDGGTRPLRLDAHVDAHGKPEVDGRRVVCAREQFEHAIKCFREFHEQFPNSHYARCAEAIEKLRDEGYVGYCVNATSVNENPWWIRGATDEDEGRPYNVTKDAKHWFFDPAERAELRSSRA